MHRRRTGSHCGGGDGLSAANDLGPDLPYIDTHEVAVAAPPEDVWSALRPALVAAFDRSRARRIAWFLECEDEGDPGETLAGFHVARSEPPRELVLEGRHRFSRYRLAFEIESAARGSRLRAVTHAEFPRARGRVYRALVIGSGGHRIVTKRLLRSIARRAESGADATAPASVANERHHMVKEER